MQDNNAESNDFFIFSAWRLMPRTLTGANQYCANIPLIIRNRVEKLDKDHIFSVIDFHILNFTRPEGGGCIVIRRRPITL
jgi:hypothetical protein